MNYIFMIFILVLFMVIQEILTQENNTCPFTSLKHPVSKCPTCRSCPFIGESCCLREDEIELEQNIQISGSDHWDCRLIILRYIACGHCSPQSEQFISYKNESRKPYITIPDENISVKVCKNQCKTVYQYCKGVPYIGGGEVVPNDISEEEFCKNYSETECYNKGSKTRFTNIS
eukprot:gb/GECH01008445.1/.p1 GENE.gb/GECH01008445.1/~~gb/GECH01008445.1/.p1  ORF type:complete len:174 (+),score=16.50 gb/GECH01008445.1/:1-522(+)